ncbi:MAG: class II fructose-bisphosphate aldolase [Patescibacteria group bacterium]
MQTLKEILKRANDGHWAVPHFNISNLEMLKAIIEVAREKKSPVLVGLSEGERNFVGLPEIVALIQTIRKETGLPIYLNADHSGSVETARAAVDAGFDSVHIDLSKKPFEENIAGTREIVEYAKQKNPLISIEGEIGFFMTDSSKVYDKAVIIPTESLAKAEDAIRFVKETGVNRLAPVVGGIHGVSKSGADHLDLGRILEIHKNVPEAMLVLHGGSGDAPEDIKQAIANGIANIHISTDIRVAYLTALREAVKSDEYVPYKLMASVVIAMKKVISDAIDLFGSAGRV